LRAFDETAAAWSQLNKLAYWSATGSGKTLLMHANILQYQHALKTHGDGGN
jgi:chromosomal replication initiation ATPase DnaA